MVKSCTFSSVFAGLLCLAGCASTTTGVGASQELRLGSPFSSHMVLQRDVPVPIWGADRPRQEVVIRSGESTWTALADSDGSWTADIGPFAVGEPFSIMVDGSQHVLLEDVLAGEVWLASGQSNMEWALKASDGADEVIPAANHPQIRFLTIPHTSGVSPQQFVDNPGWTACTPESAAAFSGIGYFFAKEIHEDLKVPVGVVLSTWGGSVMEAWTPTEAMAGDPMLAWTTDKKDEWTKLMPDSGNVAAEYRRARDEWRANPRGERLLADPGDAEAPAGWTAPDFDDSGWDPVLAPDQMNLKLWKYDGVYLFRKVFELPADWAGKELKLELGSIDDEDITWFNGVEVGRTAAAETPGATPVLRTYTVPAEAVRAGRNVIAIRNFDREKAGGLFGPADKMTVAPVDGSAKAVPLSGDWLHRVAHREQGEPVYPLVLERRTPTLLYNAMIHPLEPMRFRGVIWYQGESNCDRWDQFPRLFDRMITTWRTNFGHGDFPFLYVQLAGYGAITPHWIDVMDAQRRSLSVASTAMAVAADVGDEKSIHPTNKRTMGHRLALAARATVYDQKIEYSGPLIAGAKREGNLARLSFTHVGSGLLAKSGAGLRSFELAGADGKYFPAEASIYGDSVVVKSADVAEPRGVRYAWKSFPECDLYNREGLPASPFKVAVLRDGENEQTDEEASARSIDHRARRLRRPCRPVHESAGRAHRGSVRAEGRLDLLPLRHCGFRRLLCLFLNESCGLGTAREGLRSNSLFLGKNRFWAPEVVKKDDAYFLIYSGAGSPGNIMRICVATASSPLGPFTDVAAPLFNNGQSYIDGHVFIDTDNTPWLYLSQDMSVPADNKSETYVAKLNPTLTALASGLTLCVTPDKPWEIHTDGHKWNEAPAVLKHGGYYYLLYTGNLYATANYAVGYATATSPTGPWTKYAGNPIVKKTTTTSGPGHCSVTTSPDGAELWMAYHTHRQPSGGGDRQLAIDRITFTPNGSGPDIMQVPAGPSSTLVAVPAGAMLPLGGSDDFNGTALDGARWTVFSDNPAKYNVNGGALNLTLQDGDTYGAASTMKNIFLQYPPTEDFRITMKFEFQPHQNIDMTFLSVWQDHNNYIRFAELWLLGGPLLEFGTETNGTFSGTFHGNTLGATKYFRLEKLGNQYSCFSSPDGATFTQVGATRTMNFTEIKVGFGAASVGNSAGNTAKIDSFTVEPLRPATQLHGLVIGKSRIP